MGDDVDGRPRAPPSGSPPGTLVARGGGGGDGLAVRLVPPPPPPPRLEPPSAHRGGVPWTAVAAANDTPAPNGGGGGGSTTSREGEAVGRGPGAPIEEAFAGSTQQPAGGGGATPALTGVAEAAAEATAPMDGGGYTPKGPAWPVRVRRGGGAVSDGGDIESGHGPPAGGGGGGGSGGGGGGGGAGGSSGFLPALFGGSKGGGGLTASGSRGGGVCAIASGPDLRSKRTKRLLGMLLVFACLVMLSSALDVRRATMKTIRKPMKVQLSIPALSSSDDDVPPPDGGAAGGVGSAGDGAPPSAASAGHAEGLGASTAGGVAPSAATSDGDVPTLVLPATSSPDLIGAAAGNATPGTVPYHLPLPNANGAASGMPLVSVAPGDATSASVPVPELPSGEVPGGGPVSPPATGSVLVSAGHGSTSATTPAPVQLPQPPPPPAADTNLSPQELRDDVDQLIAHVDAEEKETSQTTVLPPSTELATGSEGQLPRDTTFGAGVGQPPGGPVPATADAAVGTVSADAAAVPAAAGVNSSAVAGDVPRLSIEEEFLAAKARLKKNSVYLGAGELLYMDALSLQATHGDCETLSASEGGSLFKTDAEVATDDVERGSAQWGAWCVFRGKYKSDAMRQFAAKERVLQDRIVAVLMASAAPPGTGAGDDADEFGDRDVNHGVGDSAANGGDLNATAASVPGPVAEDSASAAEAVAAAGAGDAMTRGLPAKPASTSLFSSTATANDTVHPMSVELVTPFTVALDAARTLVPDVDEHETRFVSALALQGLHGDCNGAAEAMQRPPAGSAAAAGAAAGVVDVEDPVLQARVGRKDALWGAWCVLGGKPRDAAARELIARVDLLNAQKRRLEVESGAAGAGAPAEDVDTASRQGRPAGNPSQRGEETASVERRVLTGGGALEAEANASVVAAAIAEHVARHYNR